jgi:hypothetical protein
MAYDLASNCTAVVIVIYEEAAMKKQQRKHQQVKGESTVTRKPLRKVIETKDGGFILDDRDAAQPFLVPPTPRSITKKVA